MTVDATTSPRADELLDGYADGVGEPLGVPFGPGDDVGRHRTSARYGLSFTQPVDANDEFATFNMQPAPMLLRDLVRVGIGVHERRHPGTADY